MKKALFLLCSLLLLAGCNKSTSQYSEERLAMYASYYNAVLETSSFEEYSRYFDISYEVTENNGTYLYYVFVDNPRIAMYDVEMIVVEGMEDYSETDMYPSFGIFDEVEYNMLPGQVNAEKGYVRGIVTSGDTDDISKTLYVMVTWKDLTRLNQSREFLEVHLNDGINSDQRHEAETGENGDEADTEDEE